MNMSAMRLSFNQPAFIPWGGFFARLLATDKMVLLDDTALAHGFTYVNRNRIKGPSGELWITVPLKRKGRSGQKIRDLEIYEKARWAKKFLLTLEHFYGKSVYFEPLYREIKAAAGTPDESFMNLILRLLGILKHNLNVKKETVLQSEIGISGKGTSLLVSIARELGAREVILPYFSEKAVESGRFVRENIRVQFLRYSPPPYPQFWGEFVQNLSVLDLLLCLGRQGRKVIENGTKILS
jgi:WbqC-like protein family